MQSRTPVERFARSAGVQRGTENDHQRNEKTQHAWEKSDEEASRSSSERANVLTDEDSDTKGDDVRLLLFEWWHSKACHCLCSITGFEGIGIQCFHFVDQGIDSRRCMKRRDIDVGLPREVSSLLWYLIAERR